MAGLSDYLSAITALHGVGGRSLLLNAYFGDDGSGNTAAYSLDANGTVTALTVVASPTLDTTTGPVMNDGTRAPCTSLNGTTQGVNCGVIAGVLPAVKTGLNIIAWIYGGNGNTQRSMLCGTWNGTIQDGGFCFSVCTNTSDNQDLVSRAAIFDARNGGGTEYCVSSYIGGDGTFIDDSLWQLAFIRVALDTNPGWLMDVNGTAQTISQVFRAYTGNNYGNSTRAFTLGGYTDSSGTTYNWKGKIGPLALVSGPALTTAQKRSILAAAGPVLGGSGGLPMLCERVRATDTTTIVSGGIDTLTTSNGRSLVPCNTTTSDWRPTLYTPPKGGKAVIEFNNAYQANGAGGGPAGRNEFRQELYDNAYSWNGMNPNSNRLTIYAAVRQMGRESFSDGLVVQLRDAAGNSLGSIGFHDNTTDRRIGFSRAGTLRTVAGMRRMRVGPGLCLIAATIAEGVVTLYMNDQSGTTTSYARTSTSSGVAKLYFGGINTRALAFGGRVHEAGFAAAAATSDEITALFAYLRNLYGDKGETATTPTLQLNFCGDSITNGMKSMKCRSWPMVLRDKFSRFNAETYLNGGFSYKTGDMAAAVSLSPAYDWSDTTLYNPTCTQQALIYALSTNDLNGYSGPTAAATYASNAVGYATTTINQFLSANPTGKVFVCGPTASSMFNATYRAAWVSAFQAYCTANGYTYVPLDSVTSFDADGFHPDDTGHDQWATAMASALASQFPTSLSLASAARNIFLIDGLGYSN